MVRHCSGGLILGFQQYKFPTKTFLPHEAISDSEKHRNETVFEATPWNNLEAGIIFSLDIPMLVFREKGITGGVFDIGGQPDLFIQDMPSEADFAIHEDRLQTLFQNWASDVKSHYYMK